MDVYNKASALYAVRRVKGWMMGLFGLDGGDTFFFVAEALIIGIFPFAGDALRLGVIILVLFAGGRLSEDNPKEGEGRGRL